jgi:hypothetical protein
MSPEVSERITITVPRGLFDRLQKVKDNINVSGVCQEGLEMAISKEEIKNMEGGEMEKLIERLKAGKVKSEKCDRDAGFQDGRKNAMQFEYQDFKVFERIHNEIESCGHDYDARSMFDDIINDCVDNPDEFFGEEWNEPVRKDGCDRIIFLEGYVEGVLDLWSEVSDKI